MGMRFFLTFTLGLFFLLVYKLMCIFAPGYSDSYSVYYDE